MNALKSARWLPLATLATSLLAGCAFHSRSWQEQQAAEGASTESAKNEQPTVVQAGAPADGKRDADADRKSEKSRRNLHTEQPAAGETPGTRMWRLNQDQINALLEGADSDEHLLALYLLSNDINLSFAKLAYVRGESPEVKAFAKRIITDHTQMIATLKALIEEPGIIPADNRATRDLRDRASLGRDSLATLEGRAFDIAYVRAELDAHRELLAILDEVVLPRADDGAFREMVATMRPIVSAHVAHAEQLQATVGKR